MKLPDLVVTVEPNPDQMLVFTNTEGVPVGVKRSAIKAVTPWNDGSKIRFGRDDVVYVAEPTGDVIAAINEAPLVIREARAPSTCERRCGRCNQEGPAASGEYPCEACGRATLHDEASLPPG